ncbi:alpha-aminoadipic semialdehyde synthase, mitochondrial isoform X1 [Lingula anatina]|uniref:Alpha-aminoadipic semialdehyde synthase, mitochondrial isoform X1 n=1 Tax=Lingula anatina TaxID=7574 RepID=A0A1S3JZQ3_LINAN|nr:alpha-aminoadipic semialdehyde synthase, mitochondrial isoform X1 [Lingula anatina]|eukprot:XP_013415516.1 alpha-aminoadipic semialdehyde synthase, mitochondrial isoform X1 [Lingula anatina]
MVGVVAVSREQYNPWERRATLGPRQVRQLVEEGVKVIVQPSKRRGYTVKEYQEAGATIQEDMSEASIITSIKDMSIESLIPNKTYTFFSHTIKAQPHSMPLLDAILEKNIRLVDYEKLTSGPGIWPASAMSRFAGIVGVLNILHGIGLRLMAFGFNTPFAHIAMAHNYVSYEAACQAVRDVGRRIAEGEMCVGPLTFVFTGAGGVSRGAQEMFKHLPHEFVTPDKLPEVAQHGEKTKLYATIVDIADDLSRISDGGFDEKEYNQHPELYQSNFAKKVAPYASCIVNGVYWQPGQPRLLTDADAKTLLAHDPNAPQDLTDIGEDPILPRQLLAICDISADEDGSIQWTKYCTTADEPFCIYNQDGQIIKSGMTADGVLMCSVDNMPAQFPKDATDYFGELYLPYLKELLKTDANSTFEEYQKAVCPALENAVIATNGKLAPKYQYIADLRAKSTSQNH